MTDLENFDLVIIGGGPGGCSAAARAGELGLKTAIVERDKVGGTCLNRGCIPTKALLKTAELVEEIKRAQILGINVKEFTLDMEEIQKRKVEVINRLRSGIENFLKQRGVRVLKGSGKLIDRNLVEVWNDKEKINIKAKNVIIATGSKPSQILEPDGENVLSSDHALELKEIPPRIVIVGAGAVGLEFSTFFALLGSKVTVVEMLPEILPGVLEKNSKIAVFFRRTLKKRGIDLKLGAKIDSIAKINTGVISRLSNGETIESDKVLVAIGRKPDIDVASLERLGITVERGRIKVDSRLRTSIENVYAIGDIVDGPQLAHKAEHEGEIAAEIISGIDRKMDYSIIPQAVFTVPEFASVGLSEEQAKRNGFSVRTGEFLYAGSGKAVSANETEGLARIFVNRENNRILGAQILGYNASNLIAEISLAMKNGLTAHAISETIHVHPTFSEIVMDACRDAIGKNIHK
jgi:dihydrolipoamide dehydrogenase